MDLLLLFSIALMIMSPPLGMVLFFFILLMNMFSYMKQKREVEPYLTSFAYVGRILDFAKELKRRRYPYAPKNGGNFPNWRKNSENSGTARCWACAAAPWRGIPCPC